MPRIMRVAYQGKADLQRMSNLARQCAQETLHVVDLPYRFSSWALDDPQNVCLWLDEHQQLIAWAALQSPFWTIDMVLHPTCDPQLLPQVLDWADQRARHNMDTPYEHPQWFVNVFERQAARIAGLVQAGFASQGDVGEDSWSKVWMSRSAQDSLPMLPLPPGFTVRPLAGASEVSAYVALQREVFGTNNMTEAWRRRTLDQPEYNPDLDLVIAAPDGQLAAFCVLWLARLSPQGPLWGQVEPMGVSEKYRGMGFGKAILAEGLRRLGILGASQMFVETDAYRNAALALYASVGFRIKEKVLVFRKDYVSD